MTRLTICIALVAFITLSTCHIGMAAQRSTSRTGLGQWDTNGDGMLNDIERRTMKNGFARLRQNNRRRAYRRRFGRVMRAVDATLRQTFSGWTSYGQHNYAQQGHSGYSQYPQNTYQGYNGATLQNQNNYPQLRRQAPRPRVQSSRRSFRGR